MEKSGCVGGAAGLALAVVELWLLASVLLRSLFLREAPSPSTYLLASQRASGRKEG
ncbi:uncharacterized protein K452DRAFT_292535 [Aplosporella prunicola CBS 121167]|uniref:Uncharacterized protein n=1 Tax=Aplosporella prunicola CBS 121167 TaxID=1176127 RepID=A0A6A6AXB8_9PEZI|nr:uncharacterized protein K452DRAFT_292535 [Aplosporella prunicola CBS 121167]KAF2136256.1 hypothetical protein K452DRAFT_292535 [Aplosporella prunicola CBS 121167]